MKKYLLMALILTLPINGHTAACGSSSGVITVTDNSCSVQPDEYGITMYKMYLCTSAPTAPTTSTAAVLTSCFLTFDGGTSGASVNMTGTGSAGAFSGATFFRPDPGVYTHGYMIIDNIFNVKYAAQFNEAKEGSKSGTDNGVYCGTVSGTGSESDPGSTTCGSSAITAGTWGAQLTSFNGSTSCVSLVSAENLNGTGNNISGVLINSSELRTSDCTDSDKLVGIQTFGTAVTITPNLQSLNVAFGISEGMTIFENGASPPVINMGSGPFQAVITTVDY